MTARHLVYKLVGLREPRNDFVDFVQMGIVLVAQILAIISRPISVLYV